LGVNEQMADADRPGTGDAEVEQQQPALDAPWLEHADRFDIVEVAAGVLRPGWYCYVRESRMFARIVAVQVIRTASGTMHFIDLANGQTLALAPDQPMIGRRPD